MNSLSGVKIFITGATGFIGSNLVRRVLNRDAEVYINVRKTSDTWRINEVLKDISIIPVDINEYEKLKESMKKIRPNIIFHTAVYGGNASQSDTKKIFETNILGTINLLQSCKDLNFDIFVNTGSSSEYGIKNFPMHESDLLEPVTDYGVSKAAATLYCQNIAINDKLPIVTLRLFSPYGPYEQRSRLVSSLILAALQKTNLKITSRKFVRDFIFIEDVLDTFETAINLKNPLGKILNVGSGQQRTVGEVADILIRLFGNEVTYEEGLPQVWKNEPAFWQADIHRAKSELNWRVKYTMESGLAATINWFKKNKALYA